MRIAMFYHSLVSDWNHGNAHFLRGVVTELQARGHQVRVFEPVGGWSAANLLRERGEAALRDFRRHYPSLHSVTYDPADFDPGPLIGDADLVLVHEWNDHALVAAIGEHRRRCGRYRLLFHDTHHRSITDRANMARYDLRYYDGVLAFGDIIRRRYLDDGWAQAAWTWHEAADTRHFRPLPVGDFDGDLVWIGNWGDDERTAELHEFLLGPVKRLGLKAKVYGVRYPAEARAALAEADIEYGGWLPNHRAPEVFSRYRVTVHVPRRPYVEALPGIPTIRVFEALACGIPLVSAPWEDREGLFEPGHDFLQARDGDDMQRQLQRLLNSPDEARDLARRGRDTIVCRHTCAHRADELLAIAGVLGLPADAPDTAGDVPRTAAAAEFTRRRASAHA